MRTYIQKRRTSKNATYNYNMIDIMKLVAAIMVICVHCNQLFPHEYLNFFVKNIVCRIAVPFFFISSAFFVRKGSTNHPDYVSVYLKRLTKSYILWSIVFIPIGLDWIHQNLSLPGYLLPFALIYGLIHIGTYYHLWYIPATILTIFLVDRLLKRFSYKALGIAALILFMFGSIESYYGLLQNGWFKDFFDVLIAVIFTTRSGLLFGMIFTLMGFYIYDHKEQLRSIQRYIPLLLILSMILLIVEGSFLFTIEGLDMNFLLMLIPFGFFFFLSLLYSSYTPMLETRKLRELSKYYYFVHPVCIVIVEETGAAFDIDVLHSGLISVLLVILCTHLLSSLIIKLQAPLHKANILISVLSGIAITFVSAGLFFWLKPTDIPIKFEFVPCLWFFSSFIMYYILDHKASKQNLKSFQKIKTYQHA